MLGRIIAATTKNNRKRRSLKQRDPGTGERKDVGPHCSPTGSGSSRAKALMAWAISAGRFLILVTPIPLLEQLVCDQAPTLVYLLFQWAPKPERGAP